MDPLPDPVEHDYIAGSLPAVASSVTALRHAVARFAREHGLDDDTVGRISLAVTEAAGNVVRHAYAPSRPGAIGYVADVAEDDLQVVVSDEGSGARAGHGPDGPRFGLVLIAEAASDFGIAPREPHGLEVWMRFVAR